MLAQLAPPTYPKADSRLFTRRDSFTIRAAPRATNPAVLLFRHEPT
jgi:hypothetical protein